ncbi:VPGUxxT family thioredoxin-like (seleno)protein, type 2 [Flavilitoribacter nigricans]|uniref:peptide-methionine (S)-S-oxide reductase n=1 Tax=Flavilitoribacter nigricans (strain ATCC 23147 / DSM 23189 / NBRC 102662 / NCIMB 1420 / SS-2) TaxID=1122177 RepID=A0A2D0N2X8_FLAN2|nr:VPGUxxT family thioredoxin-like (seleno)protein, type 2 [Flavilitoribacter nigricans]PHN02854.1 hypothetical protein CRP01_30205 [Flavilitoribacter nigricans DSM 23189 = NBRC 102662]
MKYLTYIFLAFLIPNLSVSQNPVELGKVKWLRNYDQALQESQEQQKPVFILFQEVPGCATCRTYGQNVLSHPLIVEAIETSFIPLAIYNNKGGADKKVLDRYHEPAWNNPVVRMVNQRGEDLMPRISGDYSALGVAERMVYALQRANREVPLYLQLLRDELRARREGTSKATFAMYCFWTGEKQYGQLEGVVSTRAGFMDGHEVVEVEYNPEVISLDQLIKAGKNSRCADRLYTHDQEQTAAGSRLLGTNKVASTQTFRSDRQPKYYLFRSHYRAVPMTDLQAARANALMGQGKSPDAVLSPRQIAYANSLAVQGRSNFENLIGTPIEEVW